ncbi:MAG TPA: bacteriohopanetetrol glucosamine biosynthesis glycosyltransferase HpnI [Bryobacteraceae bacterium]|jgi:ceramide glucosyltransferase
MIPTLIECVLIAAALPSIYYLLSIYSSWKFFRRPGRPVSPKHTPFLPPVSNIKPVRGIDPDAYENFASLCRQDYPEYEIVFCVSSEDDPVVPVIQQVARDFPQRSVRIIYGSGRSGSNDKVAKLARLVQEARYNVLVISDSDVRVKPDYIRTVVAPLQRPEVGAVTCLYVSAGDTNLAEHLQSIGMISDFFPGILVARELDGVKFALGTTIATTKDHLKEFGGYESLENRPADDLLVGRLIAEQGHQIELLPYAVETVPDYRSMSELWHKRLRWIVVMRHMRPWGHVGLIFTFGLPWAVAAIVAHPTLTVAAAYFGIYLLLRFVMTWMVGIWGLKDQAKWNKLPLIVLWDAVAFAIWIASFFRTSIRWRDGQYYIRNGTLVPVASKATGN